jgi:hypothetical protein
MTTRSLFDDLEGQESSIGYDDGLPHLQRTYTCRCGSLIFFRNSFCLNCRTALGYDPIVGKVLPLDKGPTAGTWVLADKHVSGKADLYWRCANVSTAAVCNWLVPISGVTNPQSLCVSCRLNRTIPDLSNPENQILWAAIERAKRRVISALIALGLPVVSKVTEDAQRGLAFDILRSPVGGPRVLTGHEDGLITLNAEEADDITREQIRKQLHEPYRTLVGHLRHEVGHYYWDRLVGNTPNLQPYRELFGDERIDYEEALKRNYENGPRRDWPALFVSGYASIHPWEDWAETWAHYMHMLDTLSTALSFGLSAQSVEMPFIPFTSDALWTPGVDKEAFLALLNSWLKLTAVLNELCRSMGQPDFYPFTLPAASVRKLHFIHSVIRAACSDKQ